jgi:hypothetical protein
MKIGGETMQLQMKGRRTQSGTHVLYQVLYPKQRKGEAVLLEKQPGRPATGKIFVPGSGVKAIGSMKVSLFGSALSYEDAVDNFFSWDQQSFAGTEEVDRATCQILESKSGAGSSYSLVRSWIDLRRMLPLRVEKYSGSTLVRRIKADRIAKDDIDRLVVASLIVERPGGSTTEIDGSDSRHNVTYTDKDFSEEGMQSLAPPPSK